MQKLNIFQLIILIILGIALLPLVLVGLVIFGIYIWIMQRRMKKAMGEVINQFEQERSSQDQSSQHGRVIDQDEQKP